MKEGQPSTIHLRDYEAPAFTIEETTLHFDIHEDYCDVTSTLLMQRSEGDDASPLILNGDADLDTRSLAVNGQILSSNEYQISDELLSIPNLPDRFELATNVRIKPAENTALEGLYRSGDMFSTQCEAEGFRRITWYLDRPDAMSMFTTTVEANKSQYPVLLSNGNDVARGISEDDAERHWVTWKDPFRKPAYLFALVAGDLQHIEDRFTTMSGRNVQLRIYTEPHNVDKLDFAMTSLKHAMRWDEEEYGREYDLDIFMIVAVDSFNMGAMENKGLNIFNTSCVLARPDTTTDAAYQRVETVVAHEYFHNWSGNRVTCRDWFQLSLKEGFTVFRDQSFSADMGSATVCRVNDVAVLRSAQFPEDAGPMAHPVQPDSYIEINNFYTATVYEKGAEVVRMIHTLLGPERFRAGSDLYFDRHDGQAVRIEDFVAAMTDATGVSFDQFKQWYKQSGTPEVSTRGQYDADSQTYELMVSQSCADTPGQTDKSPFLIPLAVGLLAPDGRDMKVVLPEDDVAVSHQSADGEHTVVLNVRESAQTFTFRNVSEPPTPSLLRGFSAPVKLSHAYSRDELMFLMQHDNDGFNRWEAGQRLAVDVIFEKMSSVDSAVDERLMSAVGSILEEAITRDQDADLDKAMLANMLIMPTEAYLGELSDPVDVDGIWHARDQVLEAIAEQFRGQLLTVYKLNQSSEPYGPVADQIGRRALANTALMYLMLPEDSESIPLAVTQFESADNMTDSSAALRYLVNAVGGSAVQPRNDALLAFYNRWADEALVIDLWFQIQAAGLRPDTPQVVAGLLEHTAFTLAVPNRLRALVSPFTQNSRHFHSLTGEGYRFLSDRVIALNGLNPQVAARILGPLTRWQKLDARRQELMRSELTRILETPELSPDVFEIASKSV